MPKIRLLLLDDLKLTAGDLAGASLRMSCLPRPGRLSKGREATGPLLLRRSGKLSGRPLYVAGQCVNILIGDRYSDHKSERVPGAADWAHVHQFSPDADGRYWDFHALLQS